MSQIHSQKPEEICEATMGRKKIIADIEKELLINCRRRCCICYGLTRDNRVKQGQISHLDHNPENDDIDNLAFLCLDHHDQYDSKTSQSKNLTILEVKSFRNELYQHIEEIWSRPPIFENVMVDIYSGHYERGNEFESSELDIKYLGSNLIQVNGLALWGKTRLSGPNIGELDFISEVQGNKASFSDKLLNEEYELALTVYGQKLEAKEKYVMGYFGLNAGFEGEYYKLK